MWTVAVTLGAVIAATMLSAGTIVQLALGASGFVLFMAELKMLLAALDNKFLG